MHFVQDWDTISISLLKGVEGIKKTVLSYLPFASKLFNTSEYVAPQPLPRICNGYFVDGPWDEQIIALATTSADRGGTKNNGKGAIETNESAFVVAGNLMSSSGMWNDGLQVKQYCRFHSYIAN